MEKHNGRKMQQGREIESQGKVILRAERSTKGRRREGRIEKKKEW